MFQPEYFTDELIHVFQYFRQTVVCSQRDLHKMPAAFIQRFLFRFV